MSRAGTLPARFLREPFMCYSGAPRYGSGMVRHTPIFTGTASGFRRGARTLALALALVVPAGAASAQCLSQQQARSAVQSGEALPLGSVAGAVGGEIVRAELCREGGRLVYMLSVLSGGRVANRVVDARSGQVLR
jgi:hypothetical protein